MNISGIRPVDGFYNYNSILNSSILPVGDSNLEEIRPDSQVEEKADSKVSITQEEIDKVAEGIEVHARISIGGKIGTGIKIGVEIAARICADKGQHALDDEHQGRRQGDAPQDFHNQA